MLLSPICRWVSLNLVMKEPGPIFTRRLSFLLLVKELLECQWQGFTPEKLVCRFLQWCRSFKPFSSPATRLQNLQISGDAEIGEGSEIGATSPSSKVPDEGSPEKPKMPYSEVIRLQAASQSGGPIPHPQPLQRVRSIFDTPPPSPQ